MSPFATLVVMFLALAVLSFYVTTGAVRALIGQQRGFVLAAAVSFACWCATDVALHEFSAALFGAGAEVDLFDLEVPGFEATLTEKFAFYAVAHALALAPRFWRRRAAVG